MIGLFRNFFPLTLYLPPMTSLWQSRGMYHRYQKRIYIMSEKSVEKCNISPKVFMSYLLPLHQTPSLLNLLLLYFSTNFPALF